MGAMDTVMDMVMATIEDTERGLLTLRLNLLLLPSPDTDMVDMVDTDMDMVIVDMEAMDTMYMDMARGLLMLRPVMDMGMVMDMVVMDMDTVMDTAMDMVMVIDTARGLLMLRP